MSLSPVPPASSSSSLTSRIDPPTGFASDFLNPFYEAVMLLDCLIAGEHGALDELLDWRALSYVAHFRAGTLPDRHRIVRIFQSAPKATRRELTSTARELSAVLSAGARFMAACRRRGALTSIVPIARHLAADARHRLVALNALVHAGADPLSAADVSLLFAHRAA